jgi:serine protease DegQ
MSWAAGSRGTALVLTVLVLAATLIGCGGSSHKKSPSATTSPATEPGAGPAAIDVPALVRKVEPSVVTILLPGGGVGSGVIYRTDGEIVTNQHVVSGHGQVEVAFADGRRERGRVVAGDRSTDIAVVKVDRSALPAAHFQDQLPPVGAFDLMMGSPLGFEKTVTAGIVSGLHRAIPGSAQETPALVDLIQTDAPISPGNSGGAMVDGSGEVIGISVAYIPPQQGAVALGFAIPAATATRVADELIKTGRASHAFLGIQPADVTPEIARELGVKEARGVLVYAIEPGGPAASVGIQPGDVITAIAGRRVDNVEAFLGELRHHRPGDSVAVQLLRDGQSREVTAKLNDHP